MARNAMQTDSTIRYNRQQSFTERVMELVARQVGSRRDYPPVEFPLTDSQGVYVEKDRRQHTDRRKLGYGIVPLRAAFYKTKGRIRNRLILISLIVATNAVIILLVYALIVAIQN